MSDNAYDRHSYAGAAPDTTLASSISDTDLTVTCADLTGWPDGTGGNFVVIFEPGKTAEEKCLASSRSGNVLTLVSRGMEGAAAAHNATTTTVRHGYSARDANEANYAVSQTVGQVSAKGSIVVGSAANTFVELPIGSTGQALVVSGGTAAWGKPTLGQSDITGLVTALAGKLATPSTAIAKGSLLVGTGANVADSVAVGADGTVLTADSTAAGGVSWQVGTAGVWSAYTPTITGSTGGTLTVGNGTLTGRYVQVGKIVTVVVKYAAGGTTSTSGMSGNIQIALPVTPSANPALGTALSDNGQASTVASVLLNGSVLNIYASGSTAALGYSNLTGSSSASAFVATITYEAA